MPKPIDKVNVDTAVQCMDQVIDRMRQISPFADPQRDLAVGKLEMDIGAQQCYGELGKKNTQSADRHTNRWDCTREEWSEDFRSYRRDRAVHTNSPSEYYRSPKDYPR